MTLADCQARLLSNHLYASAICRFRCIRDRLLCLLVHWIAGQLLQTLQLFHHWWKCVTSGVDETTCCQKRMPCFSSELLYLIILGSRCVWLLLCGTRLSLCLLILSLLLCGIHFSFWLRFSCCYHCFGICAGFFCLRGPNIYSGITDCEGSGVCGCSWRLGSCCGNFFSSLTSFLHSCSKNSTFLDLSQLLSSFRLFLCALILEICCTRGSLTLMLELLVGAITLVTGDLCLCLCDSGSDLCLCRDSGWCGSDLCLCGRALYSDVSCGTCELNLPILSKVDN